ncbi:serpin family protein [Streptomyces brevispora]
MTRETGPATRAGAVQRLGERWMREPAGPGGGSFVCSPAGLWPALAVVAAGARGETADELRAVLGVAEREAADAVTAGVREPAATDADVLSVAVPRFTLRTNVQVTDQLPALGVRVATSAAADFAWMSPERLRISQVVQETVVKVAEEGVRAAAVTVLAAPGSVAPGPQRFRHIAFGHPFGIVVLDGSGEVPLFTGRQEDIPVEG